MNSTTTVAPSTCFDHRNEFLRLETRLSQVVLERPVCLVALVVDGTRSLAGGSFYVTTLGSVLQALGPAAFQALRSAVLSRLPTFVWDPLLVFLLMTPVGVALCGLGAAFIVLSHKHHALVGYPPD